MKIDTNQKLPILFCHYGNTHYLRYTMKCAQLTNPDTRIILLGDYKNQWLSKYVEHHHFSDFEDGELLKEFEKVYRIVAGPKSPLRKEGDLGRDWIDFVFRRWFIIYEFCKAKGIDSFWHFDSDNMILDDLSKHLYKFENYQCTEKCNGACINGYISCNKIINNYLLKIIDIFKNRTAYLDSLQNEFNKNKPTYAFTEMRAYQLYRDEENIKSIRMQKIIDGEYFDDYLAQAHGMDIENYQPQKSIKKVWIDNQKFYTKKPNSKTHIRLISIDMSCLPSYFFEIVYKRVSTKSNNSNLPASKTLVEIENTIKYKYLMLNTIQNTFQRIKSKLKI